MKKQIQKFFLSMLAILSTSCSQNRFVNCYQCYMGNMLVSTASMPYVSLNQKEIDNSVFTSTTEYYANIYVLETNKDASDFFSINSLTISEEEKNKNIAVDNDSVVIYFLVQIPSGYSAYKRDNIQAALPGEEEKVLLTDNFYFYANRTDLFYCQIDIKEDKSVVAPYVFSFYYDLSKDYTKETLDNHIRLFYSLNQTL